MSENKPNINMETLLTVAAGLLPTFDMLYNNGIIALSVGHINPGENSVQMYRHAFWAAFPEYKVVPHDDKYNKMVAEYNGVTFFALVNTPEQAEEERDA